MGAYCILWYICARTHDPKPHIKYVYVLYDICIVTNVFLSIEGQHLKLRRLGTVNQQATDQFVWPWLQHRMALILRSARHFSTIHQIPVVRRANHFHSFGIMKVLNSCISALLNCALTGLDCSTRSNGFELNEKNNKSISFHLRNCV